MRPPAHAARDSPPNDEEVPPNPPVSRDSLDIGLHGYLNPRLFKASGVFICFVRRLLPRSVGLGHGSGRSPLDSRGVRLLIQESRELGDEFGECRELILAERASKLAQLTQERGEGISSVRQLFQRSDEVAHCEESPPAAAVFLSSLQSGRLFQPTLRLVVGPVGWCGSGRRACPVPLHPGPERRTTARSSRALSPRR